MTAVVDTGLHKVARYDAERGIDSLETERITADAADQRAGRAGRVAPGVVRRLWDARDRLRPHREPEIHRIDLSSAALDVIAWGGDPRTLEWFERPRDEALDAALALLERLGLIASACRSIRQARRTDAASLTAIGEQVRRLPLHPRLARMLVAAGGAATDRAACALLSERHLLPPRTASTTSDLLSAIDDWNAMPPHVQRVADVIADSIADRIGSSPIRNPRSAVRTAGESRSSAERCSPAIPIAWPSAANRDRRTCCSRPAPARRSRRRAASATASSSSPSTSLDPHPQSSAIRNPDASIGTRSACRPP